MSKRLKIVLASTSERRKRLLERLGLPFEVVDPEEVVEVASGRPEEIVSMNSLAKAMRVAGDLEEGVVVGADTVVVKDGRILGKPRSPSEAEEMLKALRGTVHRVLTGISVVDVGSGMRESVVVETRIHMLPLSDDEVDRYVATGEPLGKAGGYAIQGLGALLVDEVHGCFYNVVGLPLSRLNSVLRSFGVRMM
ncbi:MAG: Maf family protein [Candidatus Bathyarchaeota archaeon]|nr:Maf family protein [Candidatus Bathyarchaeota archaeon]